MTHKHIGGAQYIIDSLALMLPHHCFFLNENLSSVGWALVTNWKTDDDNDDIISENPESGENDLCSSDL